MDQNTIALFILAELILTGSCAYFVYKFIALAFLGESEGKEIHHINNNGYDSRPENLIYLTSPDHSRVHDKKIKNSSNE